MQIEPIATAQQAAFRMPLYKLTAVLQQIRQHYRQPPYQRDMFPVQEAIKAWSIVIATTALVLSFNVWMALNKKLCV